MEDILHGYDVNDPTWFYLSLLLIVAVYFRFSRVWTVRNLDLMLLLALSPILLLIPVEPELGYGWLFGITALLVLRLFFDGSLRRRPWTEQNLNAAGLGFLGIAAFAFLMTIVITEEPPESAIETVRSGKQLLERQDVPAQPDNVEQTGPTGRLLVAPVVPLAEKVAAGNGSDAVSAMTEIKAEEEIAPRILAVLAHLAVLSGLLYLGYKHFGDIQLGLAMGTLYLLLPCTVFDVGKVNHVLPAAMIVWALATFQLPLIAGCLLGLACGTRIFVVFLLPLWFVFYGRRNTFQFGLGLSAVAAILLGSIVLTSADTQSFVRQTIGVIDWNLIFSDESVGFWASYDTAYRIPVFAGFAVLMLFLTIWPRQKNFEHLLAHTAAIIIGTQFWYPQQGGIYILSYVPLLLLVMFRPKLTHLIPPNAKEVEHKNGAQPISGTHSRELAASGHSGRSLHR